jgi:uncharacterized protein (TIGR02246 family)
MSHRTRSCGTALRNAARRGAARRNAALLSLCTILFTLGWAAPVSAGPREDALAVIERWVQAFGASDVDGITKLYAPDALFMGTGSRAVVTDPAGVRQYFEQALLTQRPRSAKVIDSTVLVASDTVVIVSGLDVTYAARDGQTIENPGRFTFIVANRTGTWQIVHFHRSTVPGSTGRAGGAGTPAGR